MPIELIFPEDPAEIRSRENPKGPHRSKQNLGLVCCGVVVIILLFMYFGYRRTAKPITTEPAAKEMVNIGVGTSSSSSEDKAIAKKLLFAHGVKNAKLVLETIDGRSSIRVVAQDVKNIPGITWAFEWTKNGLPFGYGDTVSGFRRGEVLTVKITPYDGETYGTSKFLRAEIKNTAPEVAVEKGTTIEGDNLSYQVKAVDPDGDSLTYSLVEAPKGMTVDAKTGVITWSEQPQNSGPYLVKVRVTDGQGGESIYPLNIDPAKPTNK